MLSRAEQKGLKFADKLVMDKLLLLLLGKANGCFHLSKFAINHSSVCFLDHFPFCWEGNLSFGIMKPDRNLHNHTWFCTRNLLLIHKCKNYARQEFWAHNWQASYPSDNTENDRAQLFEQLLLLATCLALTTIELGKIYLIDALYKLDDSVKLD